MILPAHPQAHTCPFAFSASAHASATPAGVLRAGNFTVLSRISAGIAVWRKINIAEGAGNTAGHKRQRYQTALGSAREVLACIQVAQAMRYTGSVNPKVLDRMDHVIATLGRLVYHRAS
ncbi:four helix bundle protein [Polyangium jinanense]|uniref:Four helix bundle protein n=1 Tax=Polyangium jinanense TaxID=2829994 RepID=A0A9X3XJB4_9BACT|nr:four helix bundle protein [Polyangium jinanense]MDC3962488.1 four helix bundle protein [Polyangium jinanense]MDC3989231.1 four helix bundle protein [Polyangium jinanense]